MLGLTVWDAEIHVALDAPLVVPDAEEEWVSDRPRGSGEEPED